MNKRQKTYFLGGFGGVGGALIEISKNQKIVFHCDYFAMYPESFSSLALQTKKLTAIIGQTAYRNPAHKTQQGVGIRTEKKREKMKCGKNDECKPSGQGAAIQRPPGGFWGLCITGPHTSRHTQRLSRSP